MHWKRRVGGDRFGGTQWWSLFLCIIIIVVESKVWPLFRSCAAGWYDQRGLYLIIGF